ncbi:MAG: hypothetical protein WCW17_02200 [Patescibacteria group bacterium]|jgi:hypothetical protein
MNKKFVIASSIAIITILPNFSALAKETQTTSQDNYANQKNITQQQNQGRENQDRTENQPKQGGNQQGQDNRDNRPDQRQNQQRDNYRDNRGYNNNQNRDRNYYQNNWNNWNNYNRDRGHSQMHFNNDGRRYRNFNRNIFRIRPNANYWNSHNLYGRYPSYRYYFPNDYVYARRMVLYDTDYPSNSFYIDNDVQGEYSLNVIRVGINHGDYSRIWNDLQYDSNVNISIDTGNNSILFNTSSGSISTGNVVISIN